MAENGFVGDGLTTLTSCSYSSLLLAVQRRSLLRLVQLCKRIHQRNLWGFLSPNIVPLHNRLGEGRPRGEVEEAFFLYKHLGERMEGSLLVKAKRLGQVMKGGINLFASLAWKTAMVNSKILYYHICSQLI